MADVLHDLLDQALDRWIALTGLDFSSEKRTIHIHPTRTFDEYDLGVFTTQVTQARELDPTGLTSYMMLRGFYEEYLHAVTFSAFDLILDPGTVRDALTPMNELRDILESPEVAGLIADFQAQTLRSVAHYGLDQGAVEKLVADKLDLALIRRDALRAIERLEAHQFAQGPCSDDPARYNEQVWEFWNVNSLLWAARAQSIPGISLCLLRDPEEALFSYFAFACVNGETITLLTDRPHMAHPAQKSMIRNAGRHFRDRMTDSPFRFPYHLLEIKVAPDQKTLYAERRTGLVPYGDQAVPLARINALYADEALWLVYLFDLIRDRYYIQRLMLPELSYTGEMVRTPTALVDTHSALMRAGDYQPLDLPALTMDDLRQEVIDAQAKWARTPSAYNDWMLERYGAQVSEAVLDVVGESEALQLAAGPGGAQVLPLVTPHTRSIISSGFNRTPHDGFKALDPLAFGHAEDIARDRAWTARYNQVVVINRLAHNEYEEAKDAALAWFREHVMANREFLLDAAARGELWLDRRSHAEEDAEAKAETGQSANPFRSGHDWWRVKKMQCLEQAEGSGWNNAKSWGWVYEPLTEKHQDGHWERRDWGTRLWPPGFLVTWKKARHSRYDFQTRTYVFDEEPTHCIELPEHHASIWSRVSLRTPADIAIACGCTVDDLPWGLQHAWTHEWEPYEGNSILDRLDPKAWRLSNPWAQVNGVWSVGIAQSKTAYHARRERLGLPHADWWLRAPLLPNGNYETERERVSVVMGWGGGWG